MKLEESLIVRGALDDLRRIVRVLRESSRAAERSVGVTGAQLFVLRSLADGRAGSLNALAARTRTHQSTVSVVVKRLVEGGLVRRTRSDEDARRVELGLTARGRALLARAPGAAQERLIDGLERLPRLERRRLASALRRLVEVMGLDEREPAMFFEESEPGRRRARS